MTFTQGTDAYARHVGRDGAALSGAHCAAAGVGPRDRVLDVGCGPGTLTRELAALVGAERVAAIDPSEPFVELCRAAVPDADVRQGAAEHLPFGDDEFDVVLSQLVVNFMSDPLAGVGEMRRVGRATVTSCVWDYAGAMTMLRVFWDAALELDPHAPDEARTMSHCSPHELEALWRQVDLRDVETDSLVVEADYADFDDCWSPFPTGLAPSGAYCASLDPAAQERLREACRRRLGSPAGPFTLSARAWFVRGAV